jgi:hypothetical protein
MGSVDSHCPWPTRACSHRRISSARTCARLAADGGVHYRNVMSFGDPTMPDDIGTIAAALVRGSASA